VKKSTRSIHPRGSLKTFSRNKRESAIPPTIRPYSAANGECAANPIPSTRGGADRRSRFNQSAYVVESEGRAPIASEEKLRIGRAFGLVKPGRLIMSPRSWERHAVARLELLERGLRTGLQTVPL